MYEHDELEDIPLVSTFKIGNALLGFTTQRIEEIIRVGDISKVPHAADYIVGILNLRGRIVTVIDLGVRLSLGACQSSDDNRIIILSDDGDSVGVLVDRVTDVISMNPDKLQPPPANLDASQGRFFENVYQCNDGLLGLLSVNEVLNN